MIMEAILRTINNKRKQDKREVDRFLKRNVNIIDGIIKILLNNTLQKNNKNNEFDRI